MRVQIEILGTSAGRVIVHGPHLLEDVNPLIPAGWSLDTRGGTRTASARYSYPLVQGPLDTREPLSDPAAYARDVDDAYHERELRQELANARSEWRALQSRYSRLHAECAALRSRLASRPPPPPELPALLEATLLENEEIKRVLWRHCADLEMLRVHFDAPKER